MQVNGTVCFASDNTNVGAGIGPLSVDGSSSSLLVRDDISVGVGSISVTNGGLLSCANLVVQPAGSLTAQGSFQCSLINKGTLQLAAPFGDLTVARDFSQTGSLLVRIGGSTPGVNQDLLRVTGNVQLGGSLKLAYLTPLPIGSQVKIIDNQGTSPVAGTFAGLPQWAAVATNGTTLRIDYRGGDGNDVTLWSVPTPSPGQPTAFSLVPEGIGRFSLLGEVSSNYTLLTSTNLRDWQFLTSTASPNGISHFIDPAASNYLWRFYRAQFAP